MKRNVIIDCDPGIDDSLALMLALRSEELDVKGITIVAGNTPVRLGFENAKRILAHCKRLDVPVYCGADKPLKKDFIDALDTHGKDGLGESFLDEIEGYEQEEDAVSFLSRMLKEESCSVIAIGPLTNLARLIQKDKEAFARIEELVSMGGSYKAHGNCSPVAEYNYWEDPEAAKLVFETCDQMNKTIRMVGLDVTRKIILTPALLEAIEAMDPAEGDFIRKITKYYFIFHKEWEHLDGCVINDPLAVAVFLKPELCQGFLSYVQIETDGLCRGQSVVDAYDFYRHKPNCLIYDRTDPYAFFVYFLSKLLHKKTDELTFLKTYFTEENL